MKKYTETIRSRSDLFSLLSEACELEHGLACSYLYTAFSLKDSIDEGLTAKELHIVKKWASSLFFIASQEMLHLSQAWNLLSAIGGTPYYFRPNFPQESKYYPIQVPLAFEPFSLSCLKRFSLYELPQCMDAKAYIEATYGPEVAPIAFKTVGELYGLIKSGFETIDEAVLFIGDPATQIGTSEIDFREIIKITDRRSACMAIDMITEQGEGNSQDISNSHFGLFESIVKEYQSILKDKPDFNPARDVISNPITYERGNYSAAGGNLITHQITQEVSDIFDDIYNVMLRALQLSFSITNSKIKKEFAHFAIQLMVRTIKPLGELLTRLPAHIRYSEKKAGASFGLTRHIPLPENISISRQLLQEKNIETLARLQSLQLDDPLCAHHLQLIIKNYSDLIISSFI